MVPVIGDLIKGLIFFAALFLWVRWLSRPHRNAIWAHFDYLRAGMVFGAPFMFYMLGMVFFVDFFEKAGIEVLFERYETLMLFGVFVPLVLIGVGLLLAFFLQWLGVPLPRFMYPRWVWEMQQEQREFDREQRRIKRERRRLKREQRRLRKADRN